MKLINVVLIVLFFISYGFADKLSYIDPDFEKITCNSVIKLTNLLHSYHLHSHEVHYATGSQQQVIQIHYETLVLAYIVDF
jgi:hypothetical protein